MLSEEEIIKHIRERIDTCNGWGQCVFVIKEIQGLLDRYNNLKQIEKEHQKLNGELREELEKEKEKNEKDYTSVYLKGVYDERGKWRDKIKERYEKLKHYDYIEIKELLKLLEEE